ncbi:ABC transporter ATP-binding protein [Hoeflea sp. WL0058]|uniref:ABC transporter ATP-binding protein n=1 Tax=Flavimaribacter sediminis TaxID=2865987 RepID=A0AAE2ZPG4_9HYPH|nr:ABC transporter ATP-binding protein [Flavimaribacter sediminis]MBW8638461.1 ABC transporter ATP-binding protein [Flavimaribacter sediminis]
MTELQSPLDHQRTSPPSSGVSGISICGVTKNFGSLSVLEDVSLEIEPGSFVALLGPSGCGKTTLLRIVAGLEHPSDGVIRIGNETVVDTAKRIDVPSNKRRLGMVFQSYALWPHMTVEQNIAYPLRKQGVPRSEWPARVASAIASVGLPALLDRRPSQLSGGQQQRVAIARAIAARPRVLLLDEPLSNLDASLRDQLRRELRMIHDREGITTILVTHDQEEAAMLADLVAVVRDGGIVQVGSPSDILDRPADQQVASFVGYGNFLSATVLESAKGRIELVLSDGQKLALDHAGEHMPAGKAVVIGSRSHELGVSTGAPESGDISGVRGVLEATTALGRWRERRVAIGDDRLVIRELAEDDATMEPGQTIWVTMSTTAPVLRR